jgi:DHA1 family multidrug resistance protein-like MFS transporter
MTLAVTDITGTSAAVSWLYLVNTGVVIGLGFFLPTWLGRWCRPIDLLSAGTLLLGLGLAAVGFASNTAGVLVAVGIFSLGMVIARPGQETITANLSDPAQRGTYFGVAMLALAVGGGVGNLLGGVAYDFGKQHDLQGVTWGLFLVVSAVSATGLFLNRPAFSTVRSEMVARVDGVPEVATEPSAVGAVVTS